MKWYYDIVSRWIRHKALLHRCDEIAYRRVEGDVYTSPTRPHTPLLNRDIFLFIDGTRQELQ